MKCIKSPGWFFFQPTDAVLSRNSPSIYGTWFFCDRKKLKFGKKKTRKTNSFVPLTHKELVFRN